MEPERVQSPIKSVQYLMTNYYRIVEVGVLVVQAHVDVAGVAGLAPTVSVGVGGVRTRQTTVETHQNYHKH